MEVRPNVVEAIESPHLFGRLFPESSTWAHWKVFLRALYGLPFVGQDAEVFKACTSREAPRPEGYVEAYAVVGRRGGKSRIASLIAAYEAVLGPWAARLSPGERGWIFVIATDKRQAGVVFSYLHAALELFPDLIQRETQEEIHLTNGISIGVKTCSFRASRGFTTACVIADELAFWRSEESANPADEVLNSILPGLMEGARLIGISTPYGKLGFIWEVHKAYFGKDSDILIWQAGTRYMNPTYSEATIRRLIARDAAVFRAEYDGTFREEITAFLPPELIQAAMRRQLTLPDRAHRYTAFCDPSGGRQDSMTLAVCHTEADKILVDRLEERTSPFDPGQVVVEFSDILKSYSVSSCTSDRFGGAWVESAFRKCGIRMVLSHLSASDLYLEFQPLLSMGRVELIDSPRLLLQLQCLERRCVSGGRDKVDHPPGGHDDVANAAAGAVVMATRQRQWGRQEIEARLPKVSNYGQQDTQTLMDSYMRGEGGCRIVREKA